MKRNGTPEILFGPYGSRLKEMEETHGQNGISNPAAILNGASFRAAVKSVAQEHLLAGAEIGMTHTFGLRSLLHQPGELSTYREALRTHHGVLRSAMLETGKRVKETLSFGPAGDCYTPDSSLSVAEAADFHGVQANEAAELDVGTAWFETVSTAAEALGIALAAKKYQVPCVISFVLHREGKLLSGEDPANAIQEVDSKSSRYPIGYSFNCCPIEALEPALKSCSRFSDRIVAAYPNSSSRDQKELEKSPSAVGLVDPVGAARYLHHLAKKWNLRAIGGCCGYNHRDIALVSASVQSGLRQPGLPILDR